MSAFHIYLLLVMTKVGIFFEIASWVTAFLVILGVLLAVWQWSDDWDEEETPERVKPFILFGACMFIALIISLISTGLIPSRQDLVTIYAGSYITQQKDIKEMPLNAAKAFNSLLTNYITQEKQK